MSGRSSGNWWLENLVRPLLIAAMMTCLAVPPVVILEWAMAKWAMAEWNGTYFLAFAFLASLEGILSERVLHKKRITGWGYLASRGAEALILLILLKLISYVPLGLGRLWADALTWATHPELLIGNIDVYSSALFLPLWAGSLYVSRAASELDVEPGSNTPPPDKTSTAYYLWLTQPSPVRDRQEGLDRLGEAFLWGGIAILLTSAAVHGLLPAGKVPAIPALLYFGLGIALLSQARFSVSHIGWQIQGIPVQPGIGRRWLLWTAIFLSGVALVALLLPTTYTLGPLRALLAVIDIVVQGFLYVLAVIYFVLAFLLSFVFPQVETPTPPPLPATPAPPLEPGTAATVMPVSQALLSVLFWIAILVIVVYALLRFLRDRFGLFDRGEAAKGTWWGRFLAWLHSLWQQWRTWRQGVQASLVRRWAGRRAVQSAGQGLFRHVPLRRLSPREKVRFFYLSAARRAAQAGQPRRPGQTPSEYRASLESRFPDLEPDLTGLTDAFIEARYDRRPVQAQDAEAVEPLWKRIKAALRRKRLPVDS
jgi:hypothetical protein